MKLSGIAGTGSGKMGSQVYAAVKGEQVVRNYQPKVSNPNTQKQINQRARMKLMSQLSAAMASVIVIPREGLKSSRNLFSKKNFAATTAVGGQALAFLTKFQLTNGTAALPRIVMGRNGEGSLLFGLAENATGMIDRVVYNLFARSEEGELMLVNSIVVSDPGQGGYFMGQVDDYEGELFLYAYGMKDLNARAKATYGNYKVESGEDIAKLLMSRSLSLSDYQLTETQGTGIQVDEQQSVVVPEGSVLVRFYWMGDGAVHNNSAAGAVVQSPVVMPRGTQKKWYVAPYPGYEFRGWHIYDPNYVFYNDNPLTFTAWGDLDIVIECEKVSIV